MKRDRSLVVFLLVVAGVVGGSCAASLYWLRHLRMFGHPEAIYRCYARELQIYARQFETGDVDFVEGHAHAIPQFLIDNGAKDVERRGECIAIVFESFLDNPSPSLWYCPNGLDPLPAKVAELTANSKTRWEMLDSKWAAIYEP